MAIALVQDGVQTSDTGAGASLQVVFGGNVAAGSLIVCCAVVADTGINVASFTDGTNNGVKVAGPFDALGNSYEIWAIYNHPGGEDTFTLTWNSAAGTFRCINASEWSGAATSNAAEGEAADDGNGTAATSGNVSPAPSEDGMLIVAHGYFNSDPTWGGSFATVTGLTRDGNTNELQGFRVQPTAGNIAGAWTQTSGNWVSQVASFLPASGEEPPAGGGGATACQRVAVEPITIQ